MAIREKNSYMIQLQKMGVLILEASETLSRIFGNRRTDAEALASSVREKAAEGKMLNRSIMDKMHRAPIKPLDQAHIRELSNALNGLMMSLERTTSDSIRLRIEEAVPFGSQISDAIFSQSREISDALSGSRNGGRPVDHFYQVIRLEAEIHRLHESSIHHILETAKDPIQVIKWKEIVDDLQNAAKAARSVAYVLMSEPQQTATGR